MNLTVTIDNYVTTRYTHDVIYHKMIYGGCEMDNDKKIHSYIPMSETAYYILLSLNEPRHGYGIIKYVEELTGGRISLGSGTVYGTLGKMVKDNMIAIYDDKDRKTVYEMTPSGRQLLKLEIERIKMVYNNTLTQEAYFHE